MKSLAEFIDSVIFFFGVQIFEPNLNAFIKLSTNPVRPRGVMNEDFRFKWTGVVSCFAEQSPVGREIGWGQGFGKKLGFFVVLFSDQGLELMKVPESLLGGNCGNEPHRDDH